MSTLQHLGSPSIASMVAGFPRGPRIAFAPETGAGSGKPDDKKDDAAKKDGAKPDALKKDAAPKADGAKKDEEGPGESDKLDRLLSLMDSIGSRIDATNARMDAIESKADASKADASKKDEMSQPSKEERETSGRQSEEENGQERERDKAGVGDAAKKDSSKKDEDGDKDKDEDKNRDDKAKADAVDSARYERDMAEIRRNMAAQDAKLPRTLTDAEEHAFATTQARADSAYNLHGKRAPAPMAGETLMAYRLRTTRELQKFSPTWKDKDIAKMAAADPSAYDVIEGMIYTDSAAAANNPIDLGAGELRRVKRYDEGMMRDVFEYKGRSTYVKNLSPVAQRFDGFKVSPRAA